MQIVRSKPDIDQVNSSLIKLRDEVAEDINATKEEALSLVRDLDKQVANKFAQNQSLYDKISHEVLQISTKFYKSLDEKAGKNELDDSNVYNKKVIESLDRRLTEEIKRFDEKFSQTKVQRDALTEELSTYVRKTAESLKREAAEHLRSLEDGFSQIKLVTEAQLDETGKITKTFAEDLQQELYLEIQQLDAKIDHLKQARDLQLDDTTKNIRKVIDATKQDLNAEMQRISDLCYQLRGQVSDLQRANTEASISERKFQQLLESKTDLHEVQEALNIFTSDVSRRFSNMKEDFAQIIKAHEDEMVAALKKKASVADLNGVISKFENSLNILDKRTSIANEKAQKSQEKQMNEGNTKQLSR